MAVSISFSSVISGGGVSISSLPIIESGSGPIGLVDDLPAAKTGTLTTRTDNTDGELTMTAGHGITTAQVIDLYWTGGVRYGVVVGTVATNAVPISGGLGDNLPTEATAITAVVQKSINLFVDGDEVKILAIALETVNKSLRSQGHVQFRDAANAEIAELDLTTNVPQIYHIAGGSANPFTGNPITNLRASQAALVAGETYTLKIVGVQDASP
jgi:hypothetical protein